MADLFVKIDGITRVEDARVAQDAGADCFGMIYDFPMSPRSLALGQMVDIVRQVPLPFVVVCVNRTLNHLAGALEVLAPFAVQLHGDESPEDVGRIHDAVDCKVWKVLHVTPGELTKLEAMELSVRIRSFVVAGCDAIMIDTHLPKATDEKRYGGTGTTSDWQNLRTVIMETDVPIILAGGLNASNVAEAIAIVQPAGVDCSSGVEISPGVKDAEKIKSFVSAARRAGTLRTAR